MLIVNLILPPSYYDVNLSTDKKQILLMKEDMILTAIQEAFRCAIDASNTSLHVSSVIGKGKREARREVAPSSQSQQEAVISPSVQREVNSLFRSQSSPSQTRGRGQSQCPSRLQREVREQGREQLKEPREQLKEQGREQLKHTPALTEIKEPISVVADRSRKSKKRHDPMLLSPIKRACDSPISQESVKPAPPHSVFTRTESNDLSQSTNVSRTSILQEFHLLVSRIPSLLTISSSPLFPDSQGFLNSDFAGDSIPSQASAEQELACILQKVRFL